MPPFQSMAPFGSQHIYRSGQAPFYRPHTPQTMDMGIKCGVVGDSRNGSTKPRKAFFDTFKLLTYCVKNCQKVLLEPNFTF